MEQQQQLQHFSHPEHPLVFNQDDGSFYRCRGCRELVHGPSYSCKECGVWETRLQKSCAELPLGLHHPLHPIHPLILFSPQTWSENEQFYKCELCKEYKDVYAYRCSRCDFNLHITCASLAPTMFAEFHHHPLTPVWKWITFTCDLCGKEDKGTPYLCHLCDFWIHGRCSIFPQRVKNVRHKHFLHLTHSSLEFHQSDSRFCQICVEKLDTRYGLYYCSECDYVAHLDCCMRFDINLLEFRDEDEVPEPNELIDSAAYQVKKSKVGVDGTQIDTEIKHFSHEHDLKLTDEVLNDQKCNGCARALLGPFYSCSQCGFFLHKSCANLPKTMRLQLLPYPLTLIPTKPGEIFQCFFCKRGCNGFSYYEKVADINLDVQCTLTLASDILTHKGHEHQLFFSTTEYEQTCTSCNSKTHDIFRCTICEFALDIKCATLPHTTRYKQHEHPFTLCYTVEDDSNEYYCDICEEERDPKHWFYYCENCTYPAHPNCILGKYTNIWFGDTYTFGCHPHPLTFIEETEDSHECHDCGDPCKEFILQCVQCNFYIHDKCVWGKKKWF
ncbi:hypothetical protein ACB092_03G241200 [Castanea dentata]